MSSLFSSLPKNSKIKSFRNRTLKIQDFYKSVEQVKSLRLRQQLLSVPKNPGIQLHKEQDIVIHKGDLHINGDFSLWNSGIRILLIEGSLIASGYVELFNSGNLFFGEEWAGSFHYYPGNPSTDIQRNIQSYSIDSYCIVTGDVKANVLLLGNHVEIQGDVSAEKLMNGRGLVWGKVNVPILFASYFDFAVEGTVTCNWGIGGYYSPLTNNTTPLPPPEYKTLFNSFGEEAFTLSHSWEMLSKKEQQRIMAADEKYKHYIVDTGRLWQCLLRME